MSAVRDEEELHREGAAVFSRVLYGAQVSLEVALLATAISVVDGLVRRRSRNGAEMEH